jgi:signal transduction histidine kinase
MADLRDLAAQTLDEVRKLALELRPSVLDDLGLVAALRQYVRATGERAGLSTHVTVSGLDEADRLPTSVETALFRIAQQALANVRKHTNTKRAHVSLKRLGQKIRLSVRDWGQGFDPATVQSNDGPGERVGITSMRERVALLDGDFRIHSRPGAGTLVTVDIPLPKQGEDDSEEANPE